MGDRVASWTIGISGDDSDITQFLSSLNGKFKAALSGLETAAKNIELFPALEEKVQSAAAALAKAKQDVVTFTGALAAAKDAGKDVTGDLEKKLGSAQQAVRATTLEFNRQVDAISKTQGQLTKAGVDTANLTAAQIKLAAQTRIVADAVAVQTAQQTLGLKTLKDIQPEIQRLNVAYNTLVASGAGVKELAVAQQQLQAKTAELRASVTGVAQSVQSVTKTAQVGAPEILGFFQNSLLPAAGLTLSLGTVAAGFFAVVAAGREARQALAEAGQQTNLTRDQLDALQVGAKQVAEEIGIGVVEAIKALKDIVRSTGVGPEDAISVLRATAQAAKASVTDLNVVTRVGTDLISAYGVSVADLPRVLDGFIASAKNGGPLISDLDGKIGGLAVASKAVGLSLSDMTAFLNVMTLASGDAAGSMAVLQRFLASFNTEKVQQGLRDLGIETGNVSKAIQELAARGIPVSQLVDLGVAGTKSAVALTGLTRSIDDINAALARQAGAAAAGAEALKQYLESPQGKADAFAASWDKVKLSLAGIFGDGSFFQVGLTNANRDIAYLLNIFHTMTPAEQDAALAAENLKTGWVGAADAAKVAAAETAAYNARLETNKQLSGELAVQLGTLSAKLLSDVAALQAGAARAISDAQAVAAEQIAAIDRSGKATAAGAEAKLEIESFTAQKILLLVTQNEAAVSAVLEKAIAGRIAQLKADGKTKEQIEAEILKIRLDAADNIEKKYAALYKSLEAQARANVAAVNSIEAQRVSFAEQIEQAVAAVRAGGLNAQFSDYLDRQNRINVLIAKARQEALTGDLEQAKKYSDQAISEIGRLAPAYSANGTIVVTALNVQTDKIGALKKLDGEYGAALATRGAQAKKGSDETIEQLERVKKPLDEVRAKVDEMQKKAAEGLNIELTLKNLDATKSLLDDLTKDRTINLFIKTIKDGVTVDTTGGVGGVGTFAGGGYVNRPIQGFATGGPVFSRPTWSKVPGSGDGDTVPALLQSGSFVMRKAASQLYGDSAMGQLVRGFASGGWVPPPSPVSPWPAGGHSTPATNESNQALHRIKVQAETEIFAILSRATNLPRAYFGQDVRDYLNRVLELIRSDQDIDDATALLDRVVNFYGRFYPAIEQARMFHSSVAMGAQVKEDPDPRTKGKGGGTLYDNQIAGGNDGGGWTPWFTKGNPFGFASGGPVGGEIPAMLMPGEVVLQPPAVEAATRMFGGGFLPALNAMKVPRDFDFTPPQPRRYHTGGYVDGPGAPALSTTVMGSGSAPSLTVNVYPQRFDERTFNEEIVPRIRKLQRDSA